MSRKTKRHKNNMTSENMQTQMPASSDITDTAKRSLDSVLSTVNNNKLLIGSIAGACGAGIFLLATDTGRRLRCGIQERSVDLYDYMSDQVSSGLERVRDLTQNMLSGEVPQALHSMKRSRKVA